MTINANNVTSAAPVNFQWHLEKDVAKRAQAMFTAALNIERNNWPRRMMNMTCLRYRTGRDVAGPYMFSMAARPSALAQRLRGLQWRVPEDNIVATYADVYASRIWKERPFIMVSPIAGNFKMWLRSLQMGRYIDAVMHDTKFWNTWEQVGDDACSVGDGFIKVHKSLTDEKKIDISRAMSDEMLVDEDEASYGYPPKIIQRCFEHVDVLVAGYGKTPELRDAIARAPGVHPGLVGEGTAVQNIRPFLEGFSKPTVDPATGKKIPGRHLVTIGNVSLVDEEYDLPHFPYAQLIFSRMPMGFFGQGLAEQMLPYQEALNRYDAADWENQERGAWPIVTNPIGNGVTAAQLQGGSNRIVNYQVVPGAPNGGEPRFNFPDATNQLAEMRRQRIRNSAAQRARISENSSTGETPDGLNSGAALLAWRDISDAAHVDVGQRAEDTITFVGELIVMVSEHIKPVVMLPGRRVQEIKWEEVSMSKDTFHIRAFPMSRLPQQPAARQQKIDNWFANGQISKTVKMRLEQVPDVDGYADLVNSALNDIHLVCDAIIESGEYMPPEPFQDLQQGIEVFQSRWLQERTRQNGVPQAHLDLLLTWAMQADEMLQSMGGAQTIGVQMPAGAPAAPPQQVTPSQAAPQMMPQ